MGEQAVFKIMKVLVAHFGDERVPVDDIFPDGDGLRRAVYPAAFHQFDRLPAGDQAFVDGTVLLQVIDGRAVGGNHVAHAGEGAQRFRHAEQIAPGRRHDGDAGAQRAAQRQHRGFGKPVFGIETGSVQINCKQTQWRQLLIWS